MSASHSKPRVAVFDSGLGALSIARTLHVRLPNAEVDVLADSAYAPYGERSNGWLLNRSLQVAEDLDRRGYDVWVIACNTATAAAIDVLRARYPQHRLVGLEPGLKPAAALTQTGEIAVLATDATLRSQRYSTLVERYASHLTVHSVACTGLAAAIEQGDRAAVDRLVKEYCTPLRSTCTDTLVLGCTHYPLVQAALCNAFDRPMQVVEPSIGVAERVAALLPPPQHPTAAGPQARPSSRIWTTGDCAAVSDAVSVLAGHWIDHQVEVCPWELPRPAPTPAAGGQAP